MPTLPTVLAWILKRRYHALAVIVATLLAGEAYLCTPAGRTLEYVPDADLGSVYGPSQSSLFTRVNADGHRGGETDRRRAAVVTVGDSQAFGWGLPDGEVWTDRLSALLKSENGEAVPVVNAAHPGFGPYHHLVRLRRACEGVEPRAVVVRVSIEDRNFGPPEPGPQGEGEWRRRVREASRFAPFVEGRIREQLPHVVSALRLTTEAASGKPSVGDAATGERMWRDNEPYWRAMIALAAERDVPLVFFVHDPGDLPSNGVLADRLRGAAEGAADVQVVRMGSEAWGVRGPDADARFRQYRAKFTLQHDEHGNDAHHRVVAVTVARALERAGVGGRSRGVASAR